MAKRPTDTELNSLLNPKSHLNIPTLHTGIRSVEPLPGIGSTIMRSSNPNSHYDHSTRGPIAGKSHFQGVQYGNSLCMTEIQHLAQCLKDKAEIAPCQSFADKLKACNSSF